ncbi:hypothetical protein J7355_05060 [Endozoicomonas sp. G2_2]|nr:hypothetical protein [Endozoicomonas sp. G2_2]
MPYAGRVAMAALCLALVGGCASQRVSPRDLPGSTLEAARGPDENARLYTDLIRQLISQDRLYAALAHLQAREQEFGVTDELRLLRADILRKMDDLGGARRLYEQLLDTPYVGQAHHGLGLIIARDDLAAGEVHLQKAVALVPTDARMRNDLGYAKLRQGQLAQARLQLATAYQLDEANELNRNNYILLLLAEGNDRKAARIAADNQIDAGVMRELRREARTIAGSAGNAPVGNAAVRPVTPAKAPAAVGGGGG